MVAPKFLYKLHVLKHKISLLDVLSKSNYLDNSILKFLTFFLLLDLFPCPGSVSNQNFVEKIGRNHLLSAEIFFRNCEMKSL